MYDIDTNISLLEDDIEQQYTRVINPRLGLLGILGLLGFLGFLPLHLSAADILPFPFLFFGFFGFFSFYYEGKMSRTLMDERFRFNALRAQSKAYRVALGALFLVTTFSVSLLRVQSAYVLACILLAAVGLAFGLAVFLSMYLLYRYDCEE